MMKTKRKCRPPTHPLSWPARLLVLALMVSDGSLVQADEARYLLQTSVYTTHYNPKPEHNNKQELVALEYARDDDWLVGGTTFLNSFGQRSVYAYVGREFDLSGPFYSKLTGGLLHGYRGEYQDKIPLNQLGVAPGLIPSVGVRAGAFSAEVVFLGAAALMVTSGVRF